jgi:hypothetical protein
VKQKRPDRAPWGHCNYCTGRVSNGASSCAALRDWCSLGSLVVWDYKDFAKMLSRCSATGSRGAFGDDHMISWHYFASILFSRSLVLRQVDLESGAWDTIRARWNLHLLAVGAHAAYVFYALNNEDKLLRPHPFSF